MSRYTKTQITQLSANEQAAIDSINKNFQDIQEAIADTVSRSGNVPTHMTADFDLNGKRIINTSAPKTDNDFVRRVDVVNDIATVQNLVNATTNAAAQTLQAAQEVQEIIQDRNVGLVADDLALGDNSKIKQVSENKDNIDLVASLDNDIVAVAALKDDIPVVVQAAEDIDKVEDIAEDITAVANNALNVTAVAENISNINAVNANKTNIVAVNANKTNIDAVAGNQTNISTVAGISSDVSTVAGNTTDISNVATNMSDVNDCADNMAAILDAPNQASSAAQSAQLAQEAALSITNGYDLLDHKWSDHLLNDQNWLRADTFSWQDGTVYAAAYEHLTDDITGITPTTETIGSNTITVYVASDGHKIVLEDQTQTVQDIYDETGVAWYFILDTTNQRFKLPRELPITDRVKGNGMTLGWTDGTNNGGIETSSSGSIALRKSGYGTQVGSSVSDSPVFPSDVTIGLTTDSTKSGIISHRANENGKKYLYFYVGQFSQSATEQTAGLNSELFNGKLDLDAGNATVSTKETIVGWGMPDYSAGISLSNLDTYQNFQTNGYIRYSGSGGGSWNAIGIHISVNGRNTFARFTISSMYEAENCLPLPKGYYVKRFNDKVTSLTFYPVRGGNNA